MQRQTLLDVLNTRTLTLAQIQAQVGTYAWSVPFHAATVHSPYALLYDAGAASPQTQMPIYFVNYIDWRGFMDRQPRPTGQPVRFTEWPNRTLEFDPTPTTAPSGLQWKLVLDCRVPNDVLTTQAHNPNAAQVRICADGVRIPDAMQDYERVVLIFDGDDPEALAAAREDWKKARASGHAASYWQQDEAGRWEKKA